MPQLLEKPPKNDNWLDEICQICNRPKKEHTFSELKKCFKRLKEL